LEEGLPLLLQAFLQPLCAIAICARPQIVAVFVPAILAIMRILDAQQLEIFFPIRPFLSQGRGAKADFHPVYQAIIAQARLLHVPFVFVAGNRTLTERAIGDSLQKGLFAALFHACFDEVTHFGI
jgi:hypothetical protein